MTPQQIAVAAAKRKAAIAARKASGGMTVRQQRAAAKAAKAHSTTYVPPAQPRQTAPPPPPPRPAQTAPRAASFGSKAYAQPAPTYRGLKLVALASIENAFVVRMKEQGITQDARDSFATYQKLKTRALAPSINSATQNEADTALRIAVINLVKLAF